MGPRYHVERTCQEATTAQALARREIGTSEYQTDLWGVKSDVRAMISNDRPPAIWP